MSNFEAIRSECKLSIENLEIWIRNVIDREFTSIYGGLYFDYTDSQGKRLLKTEIVKDAKERMQNTPERYSRFVDALLLDDIVKIICNPNLYQLYFKQYFTTAYPNGNEEARTFLNRLIAIRNKLYHANPISVHESLQALCYSNDVINSIKHGYKEKNMDKKYNAPTIIKKPLPICLPQRSMAISMPNHKFIGIQQEEEDAIRAKMTLKSLLEIKLF